MLRKCCEETRRKRKEKRKREIVSLRRLHFDISLELKRVSSYIYIRCIYRV